MLSISQTDVRGLGGGGLQRRGNGHWHDRLFDHIAFFSPAFHAVKHLLHLETEGCEFRGRFGGGGADDPVTVLDLCGMIFYLFVV